MKTLPVVLLMLAAHASAECPDSVSIIPKERSGTATRVVTVDDLAAVRMIDALSVSPDGRRYAILVRQADPSNNAYRLAWFSASTRGGELTCLGDGGDVRPRVMFTGHTPGEIGGNESRWSPDGQWLAYLVRKNDEIQLWRSRIDGTAQEQLTHSAADIREFEWSEDGKALHFTVGTPRTELRAQEQVRARQGYRYDEDFWQFTDLLAPQMIRPLETNLLHWTVTFTDRQERPATEPERAAFVRLRTKSTAEIDCTVPECTGKVRKKWWSEDRRRVLIWRGEGVNDKDHAFYSWQPTSKKVTSIARLRDDELRLCAEAAEDRLICVRETASQPAHVTAIDLRSARTQLLADVNPEFRALRLGKVERFEWDTPKLAWNEPGGALAGLYVPRSYGYILYPPDFDPTRKHPVFVDAYVAHGFNSLGAEHPLHAYAASGFIVLRIELPTITRSVDLPTMYSVELDYPHMTMLMESTVRALDTIGKRGFIDERRVGIGGVSHGTFVPLYMMQKYDRIAAISISSPHWGPLQYYWTTQKSRDATARFGVYKHGVNAWNGIDIAERVETIEAPVLMQLAAQETYGLVKLIRNLADAGKPYDAYVFPAETHIKWQAAHLYAINRRNLDWFRFWLQDFEDANPDKSEQYVRWRKLREQQRAFMPSSQ